MVCEQRRSSCFAVLSALACCVCLMPPDALALPPTPATTCLMIDKAQAPTVDGRLDDPVWARAEHTAPFFGMWGGAVDPDVARAWLVCDGQWLYIGFRASEADMRDEHTEAVEFCLAPLPASDEFAQSIVFLEGKAITRRGVGRFQIPNTDWNVAYEVYQDHFVIEVALPVDRLFMTPPMRGDVFEFNVSRQRKRDGTDDDWDIWVWSACGTSPGNRYRFGEVVFGDFKDVLEAMRTDLRASLKAARGTLQGVSDSARTPFDAVAEEIQTFLRQSPERVSGDEWRQIRDTVDSLESRLRRVVLAPRGVIVSACNPMQVPMSYRELPPVDVEGAEQLDIRVLANEWESAALVVTNLGATTLDGQVILTDFESADGKTKLPGTDVVQVRSAPLLHLLTGRSKRDPLPALQEGDLFRVASGENELLWLTFKSRGVDPGRYTATLTVRALDDRIKHDVAVVFRVYPLALGGEGRPRVNGWSSFLRGKTAEEKLAHARDYYLNVMVFPYAESLPSFGTDARGRIQDDRLDFTEFDRMMEFYPGPGVWTAFDVHLISLNANRARRDILPGIGTNRALLARWLDLLRAHMKEKGVPPDKWALYIADEPASGAPRDRVMRFARMVSEVAPDIITYCTIGGEHDTEQLIELSKHVDIIQTQGLRDTTMATIRANLKELWNYAILLRTQAPFTGYRRGLCADAMRRGQVGTGFWCWDEQSSRPNLWYDRKYARFMVLYDHHDNRIVPSLRVEALREGIEDWKYVLMLDEAIAGAKEAGVDGAMVAAAAAFRTEGLSLMNDANDVYVFRDAARGHLLALHTALGNIDGEVVEAVNGETAPDTAAQTPDDARLEAMPWQLQFSDSFDRGEPGDDWQVVSGAWSIDDGRLTGSGTIMCARDFQGNQKLAFDAASDEPCDLTGLIGADEGGLASGYFFGFGSDNNAQSKLMVQGREVRRYRARVQPGRTHHVVCQRQGARLTHAVDGKVVMEHVVDRPLTGRDHTKVGFYIFTSGRIDNVKVYTKGE